jgi:hypothetical protein
MKHCMYVDVKPPYVWKLKVWKMLTLNCLFVLCWVYKPY